MPTVKRNGFLFHLNNSDEMTEAIITLYKNPHLREEIAHNNIQDIKKFMLSTSIEDMSSIYDRVIASALEPIKE